MYSRKRLAVMAVFWMAIGGFMISAGMVEFGTTASSCSSAPCQFPQEANVGGIVLGTDQLTGEGLTTWLGGDAPANAELPPGSVDTTEPVAGVGVNGVGADNFFVYKSWKYQTDGGQNADTYVWINADTGQVSGTSNCGDGSGDASVGRQQCDLFAEAGELAASQITAQALGGISENDYWVRNPEDDTCGLLETEFGIPVGINVCLSLVADGSFSGVLAGVLGADEVTIDNLRIRAHRVSAIEAADGSDKELDLQNFYAEMRLGKGEDRAYIAGADPINGSDPTSSAAIGLPYLCEGSPDGSGDCNIPSNRQGDTLFGERSYDDIEGCNTCS
jgi:hypothetical protein